VSPAEPALLVDPLALEDTNSNALIGATNIHPDDNIGCDGFIDIEPPNMDVKTTTEGPQAESGIHSFYHPEVDCAGIAETVETT
jgi:hypothetical protein